MRKHFRLVPALAAVFVAAVALFLACYGLATILSNDAPFNLRPTDGASFASWVQAVGSIAAIMGAFLIGERQAAKARDQNLEIYHLRRRRIEGGARGVVGQLFGEVHYIKESAQEFRYWQFKKAWNTYLRNASQAALDAFDSLPLHELGTAARVRSAFELRSTLLIELGQIDAIINQPLELSDELTEHERREEERLDGEMRLLRIRRLAESTLERQFELRNEFYRSYVE